jgi:hypothetical protein
LTEHEKLVEEIAKVICETSTLFYNSWDQQPDLMKAIFRQQAEAVFDVVQPHVVLDDDWSEWEELFPFAEHREDLEITMHHVLTEPVCPHVKIVGEISQKKVASGSGNTMAVAINDAMDNARKRLMEKKNAQL